MSMKIENSELEEEIEKRERLGSCEICNENQAKYTCPKCEFHTCSLQCSKVHKKNFECDGIRDKTMYIPLKKMTSMDFMNDYYFLEEATRFTKNIKSNEKVLAIKRLQNKHLMLKKAAFSRNVKLFFMNTALAKRKRNFTYFDKVKDEINWHIQMIFPCADLKIVKKFNENTKILDIVKYVLDKNEDRKLDFYRSQGYSKIRVLLKAEGVKKSHRRHYELDMDKTLKECLANKVVIEYPTVYVVINHLMDDFEVIDSDDESVTKEQQEFLKTLHEEVFSKKVGQNPMLLVRPEEIPLMSKIIEDELAKNSQNVQEQREIPQTSQHNQVNNTCDDNSDSDNEIAPENYFSL